MARERDDAVPGTLNLALLVLAAAACIALLAAASRASWPLAITAAIAFSFVNNTMFSLLHEAVHGIAHRSRLANDGIGRIAAAFFPTAYSLQRVFHLGHHARNRTAFEQFDYIRPGDNRFLRYAQWYAILTGLYWLFVPLGGIAYFVWPALFESEVLASKDSSLAAQTGASSMFASIEHAPRWTIRLEILFTIVAQVAIVMLAGVTLRGWLLCYAAFAINWSSLQYTDHAFSKLDVLDGAWNLRVNPVTRALFLNYHHHLAHHRHPNVPWIHLGRYVDPTDAHPSFWRIYLSMWRGPRPLPQDLS